jgi:hypothetical protein
VRILDSQNRLYAVYNLATFSLATATNREALKRLFLAAAKAVDTDADNLPDDWEQKYFGALSAKPGDDPDGDGQDNFTEFAFGTNPQDAQSRWSISAAVVAAGSQGFPTVTFRRRAGSILDYFVEVSPDLQHWTAVTSDIALAHPLRNLFDGTGTSEAMYSFSTSIGDQPRRFVRVRAVPRSKP